jgi:DHA1 family tetracycline resistance protein-like MFS transporter
VVFLVTFGFSIFTQFLQVFLIQKFSFSQSDIGDYFAFIGICIAITQGFITRLISKRLKPEMAVSIFMFTLAIALVLILFPGQSMYLYLLSPLIAVSQGVMSPNLQTIVSNSGGPQEQGEILGMNQSVQSLAQGIPPIVAGIVVSINMYLPITLAAAFTLMAWFAFYIYRQSKNTSN